MGCACSNLKGVDQGPDRHGRSTRNGSGHHKKLNSYKDGFLQENKLSTSPEDPPLTPQQILELAQQTVKLHFLGGLEPELLATIAVIESSGNGKANVYKEDLNEATVGICQVPLSTAKWLATEKGYNHFGIPIVKDLEQPLRCMYYCGAYLCELQKYDGQEQDEHFVVCAYHAGPKWQDDKDLDPYIEKYHKARKAFRRLSLALAKQSCSDKEDLTMHVVQPGETLSKIAQISGTSVSDILAANPDIPDRHMVQANDCIAIPVPVILPRLYVTQRGDTVSSVAKLHHVSIHRLLARNPELKEYKSTIDPGWCLLIPGLRGETSSEDIKMGDAWMLDSHRTEAHPSPTGHIMGRVTHPPVTDVWPTAVLDRVPRRASVPTPNLNSAGDEDPFHRLSRSSLGHPPPIHVATGM